MFNCVNLSLSLPLPLSPTLMLSLTLSLVPTVFKQQCVCLLSWKLLECVRGRQRERVRRDIYSEMLDQSHTCPLSQVRAKPSCAVLPLTLHYGASVVQTPRYCRVFTVQHQPVSASVYQRGRAQSVPAV